MAKSLFDQLLDQIFDANWIGKRGETLTQRELCLVSLFGRSGKTLRNLYLPKDNGETSELDVIYITQKGIFVFESKNYSGWIFGDEKSMYWTAMLANKEKNRFYNPIKQNRTHLKWLQEQVGEKVPLFSIVVFSERCELKKIALQSEDVRVIKRDRIYATVRDIWENHPDALDEAEVQTVYEQLQSFTNADAAVRAAHIQRIENEYKEKPAPQSTGSSADGVCCPKCGGKLLLRTSKRGNNVGTQFYGCENYPKCRYTGDVSDNQQVDSLKSQPEK